MTESRLKKIQEIAEFLDYLITPTGRIYGYVPTFINKARKGNKMLGQLLKESSLWFSVFPCDLSTTRFSSIKVVSRLDQNPSMFNKTNVLKHFTIMKLVVTRTENQRDCVLTDSCLHQVHWLLVSQGQHSSTFTGLLASIGALRQPTAWP